MDAGVHDGRRSNNYRAVYHYANVIRDARINVGRTPIEKEKTSNENVSLPLEVILSILEMAILSEPRMLHLGRDHNWSCRDIALNESRGAFCVSRKSRKRLLALNILMSGEDDFLDFRIRMSLDGLIGLHQHRLRDELAPRFRFTHNIDTLRLSPELHTMLTADDQVFDGCFRGGVLTCVSERQTPGS
ncbi:hypothetical protein OCU04_002941 [Sclerotinia nivalis]|uniref:Uncharacterized protein n=1 Tax=Sclerotinia nivalis TaxID=352851 RepID=A0A9X0AV55_9HELO|nr:hypothetical protein OCU04_002941 [Sclerotinia nivalis]